VEISRDHLRRTLGSIGRQHDQAMKLHTDALHRAVEEGDLDDNEKDELILGGLNRRRFLTIGGVSIASAAIFAACGNSSKTQSTPTTTTAPASSPTTVASGGSTAGDTSDVTILRTASSLEVLAVDTYQTAIKSGLVTSPAVAAAAKDFMNQHAEHAAAFEAATKKAGGTPFTQPNPVVNAKVIQPAIKVAKTQTDVVALAYALETAAAATYTSTIGAFKNPAYNSAAAEVAGVESRHITVLASVLADPTKYPAYPTSGFFSTADAVKVGTGV
jgi:rubrerythrin